MFCCKGMRLANYLIEKGAKLIRVDRNYMNRNFLVFIFQDDDTVTKALETWKHDKDLYMSDMTVK